MKNIKFFSILMAISAIAFVSCSKEETAQVEEEKPQDNSTFQIIGTIKDGSLTKTQYTESEGTYTFSWTYNDEIGLIVYKTDEAPSWYRFLADNSAGSTTFSSNAVINTSDIGGSASNGWLQSGFAIYPVQTNAMEIGGENRYGVARKDRLTYGCKDNVYSNITVTLSDSYDLGADPDMNTQLSCTPLIGTRVGTTNEYEFKTAVGVLMITLNNVPTTATALRISSPSTDAPLSGTFELVSGSSDIAMAKKVSGGQSRTINFTLTTEGTKTFYIPVPIGTIPLVDGKSLKIELLDGTSYPIFSRSYTKELTISRNTITPVTLTSPDWKKLGTGKFIDNFLWGKIITANNSYSDKIDNDVPGYVPVVIEQNIAEPSRYRLVEAYSTAATQFGYTPRSGNYVAPDKYFYFTINSDSSVDFELYCTGITVDSAGKTEDLVDDNSSYDKLVAGERYAPKVVNLSPDYRYHGETSEGATYNRSEKSNQIQIIFPDAGSEYTATVSVSNLQLNDIGLAVAASAEKTRLVLHSKNAIQMAYEGNWTQGAGTVKYNYTETQAVIDWSSSVTTSGIYYLNWFATKSGDPCYGQGSIKVYLVTLDDLEIVCGQWGASPSASVVIAASNDVTKGSIMITSISSAQTTYTATYGVYGYTYYNATNTRQQLVFNSGQLFADYNTGLSNEYGEMDKLSFQGLTYNKQAWESNPNWNIPLGDGSKLYYDNWVVLRPTNDVARSVDIYEGYGSSANDYGGYLFDCYGLNKQ